jgi:very-short-patch-repair endonuclease
MSDNSTPIGSSIQLRREMTKAEKLIWNKLRNRHFLNLKFLRQHPFVYQMIDNKPRILLLIFIVQKKN